MELTDTQKKKLLMAAQVVDSGNLAILEKIVEFQEFIEKKTEAIDAALSSLEESVNSFKEGAVEEIRGEIDNIKKEAGKPGEDGKDYILTDNDKKQIAERIKVPIVERIETIREQPIVKEMMQTIKEIKEVAIAETAEQIVEKLNSSKIKISRDQIEGLRDIENIAKANAVPPTTNFFNGLRAKNLNIVGGTATQSGDTVTVTVSASGGGYTKETPTGTVNGANTTFTVTATPVYIVADGSTYFENAGYVISGLEVEMTDAPTQFIRSFY